LPFLVAVSIAASGCRFWLPFGNPNHLVIKYGPVQTNPWIQKYAFHHCSLFAAKFIRPCALNLDCIFNETGARNRGIQGYGFHRSQLSSLSFSFNPVNPANPFKRFSPCFSRRYPLLFYDDRTKEYQ